MIKMIKKIAGQEKGINLVESVVAVAIVGIAVTAFAIALSSGSLAIGQSDEAATAQSLARTQMEYIKGYTYDAEAETYPAVDTPDGYAIAVSVSAVADTDENIQKVTAVISRDGQEVLSVSEYKVNR